MQLIGAKANAEFLAVVHLYWPHVYQYVQRSYEAMQDALEHLYNERDSKDTRRANER